MKLTIHLARNAAEVVHLTLVPWSNDAMEFVYESFLRFPIALAASSPSRQIQRTLFIRIDLGYRLRHEFNDIQRIFF
jgi:hypothetical protein